MWRLHHLVGSNSPRHQRNNPAATDTLHRIVAAAAAVVSVSEACVAEALALCAVAEVLLAEVVVAKAVVP